MSFLGRNLDKVAPLCVGLTAVAFGPPSAGAIPTGAIEAGVGALGLFISTIKGNQSAFGLECDRVRQRIQEELLKGYGQYISSEGDRSSDHADIWAANEALTEVLGECLLDRGKLAAAAVTPEGFSESALSMIMGELGIRRPHLFSPRHRETLGYRFAQDVVRIGLRAALENPDYYRQLEPGVMLAIGQSLGQVDETTQAIARDQQGIAQEQEANAERRHREIMQKLGGEDGERVARLERDLHLTRSEFRALLSDIVGQGVEAEDITSALATAKRYLEESRAELGRLRSLANEVPEIEPYLAAAREALENRDRIDLAAAQAAIAEAKAAYRSAISARHKAEAMNLAWLTESEAAIALARFDFLGAARLFGEAASELPESEKVLAAEFHFKQGDALRDYGGRFVGLASLEAAVVAYEVALQVRTREAMPAQWAATQNHLGNAYLRLGERAGGEARRLNLKRAVAAYEAALQVFTREDVPAQWAVVQNNLGSAWLSLGECADGEAGRINLRVAVAAYEAALQVHTREDMPAQWAGTQSNLGNAYLRLGERAGGQAGRANFEKAVAAYEAALHVTACEDMLAQWSLIQNNLGNAYRHLGEGEAGRASLEKAVAAYEAALQVRTREAMPALWAGTQSNLGLAWLNLGERAEGEAGRANFEKGVTAFEAALQVFTREAMPALWATTQNNLGSAYRSFRERAGGEAGRASLEKAVAAYEAALQVRTREDMPADWAMTQGNLGNVYHNLGECAEGEAGRANLEKAVAAYEAALQVFTREDMPAQWAGTQSNLGNIYRDFGERMEGEAGRANFEKAIAAYEAALQVFTREDVPAQWAVVQNNLGNAYLRLGERMGGEAGRAELEKAVAAYEAALQVYNREDMPVDWAMTQNNLGSAYRSLGERTGGEAGYAKLKGAVTAFEAALQVRTRDDMPALWGMTQDNLGLAYVSLGDIELRKGDAAKATKLFERGLWSWRVLAAAAPHDVQAQFKVGQMLGKLAITELGIGAAAQAHARLIKANAVYDALIAGGGDSGLAPGGLGLNALMNSVEMALLLGDPADAVARARRVLSQSDNTNHGFAIMPFLIWLADPVEETPEGVVSAIERLAEGVRFIWSFHEIAPLVAELPPKRKRLAEAFIAHFEGRLDLAALKEIIGGPASD